VCLRSPDWTEQPSCFPRNRRNRYKTHGRMWRESLRRPDEREGRDTESLGSHSISFCRWFQSQRTAKTEMTRPTRKNDSACSRSVMGRASVSSSVIESGNGACIPANRKWLLQASIATPQQVCFHLLINPAPKHPETPHVHSMDAFVGESYLTKSNPSPENC